MSLVCMLGKNTIERVRQAEEHSSKVFVPDKRNDTCCEGQENQKFKTL